MRAAASSACRTTSDLHPSWATGAVRPVARARFPRYPVPMRRLSLRSSCALAAFLLSACAASQPVQPPPPDSTQTQAFLDTVEQRTFHYFWDLTNTSNGLTPDRSPSPSFSSIAAVGFALTAYPIGAERGYVSRQQARDRALTTLQFLWTAAQDSSATATGYRGFFYHFLDMGTGDRKSVV